MKNHVQMVVVLAGALIIVGFTHFVQVWSIDPSYVVRFETTQASGIFTGLKGTIQYDPNNLRSAHIEVSVDVKTIDTGNKTKNSHAQGENWFDVENHPQIKFTSESFTQENKQSIVTGQLELRGVQKNVTIPYIFVQNGNQAVFEGEFVVNRQDFGIDGGFGGFMVGNEITVTLKIPVSK